MATRSALVGRTPERTRLAQALERARLGRGSLVLVSGEAGVGKTRLVEAMAEDAGAAVLCGRAGHGAPTPYGPIAAALRSHLRSRPRGLDGCGPLGAHLALILPELGDPPPASDRATLFEAVSCAIAHLARRGPVVLVLDDMQWSDDATLDLLPALAEPISELPVLAIAAYRSDGLPRDHPLRRVRHELRRGGRLDELTLEPLAPAETAELLAQVLGGAPAPALARTIHDRTQGVPFFVEELARALSSTESVAPGPRGIELAGDGEVPVPETVRDAVLIGAAELSQEARAAAEAAAVAGESFDLALLEGVSESAGLAELVERGIIWEDGAGRGAFRHALTREALYADVPWLARRALHRRLAQALEADEGPRMEVATHWLAAREGTRAREALLAAADDFRTVHAYRDAARAGRQALELWPDGEEEDRRVETLESYADSAELAGELADAASAWREIAAIRAAAGSAEALASAERRLAGVHDLRGDRESALVARRSAAAAYAAAGCPAEAAVERLTAANYLRGGAHYTQAIELARAAGEDAEAAGRLDLRARALGLEGVARAKRGDHADGLETVRAALTLALDNELTSVAAELYQRLSLVLYDAADYRRAERALESALELCRTDGSAGTEVACVTCLVYVLRECGEWPRALTMGRDLIDKGTAVWVAEGLIGAIHGYQGKLSSGRRLLTSSLATSARVGHFNMTIDSVGGLAWVAAAEGANEEAVRLCRTLLERWERSEDHHYAVRGLRWGSAFLARRGELDGAQACARALARIASDTGHPDALAALAHAIGETALADGDPATAAEQIARAADLHRALDMPFERAEIVLRAGVALAAAGEREAGIERLGDAYRAARKLGARPLAAEAAGEVAALGESVVDRLGRRAAADADGGGLSPRELQVIRLVAVGRTNREIAHELYLSPRTVDMHVRSVLRKLDCRSRGEAAHRAAELGLLDPGGTAHR